jgi:hypothetical protein
MPEDCAYPGCDCHDAEITITICEETNHYCCAIHAAMALLINGELDEQWIMNEVRNRVWEAREARARRQPSSQRSARTIPVGQSA